MSNSLKNVVNTLFFVCILFISYSCKDNKHELTSEEEKMIEYSQPEYDSDNQCILFKDYMSNDIKENLDLQIDQGNHMTATLSCRFSFFNYGGAIRLSNAMKDDYYAVGIGSINAIKVLDKNDIISITDKRHDDKYGDWAFVNLTIGNAILHEVFLTPLALKEYKAGNDDSLIFVQFIGDNKYMNVIFVGSIKACGVVRRSPNTIVPDDNAMSFDALKDGPGQFWHDIRK